MSQRHKYRTYLMKAASGDAAFFIITALFNNYMTQEDKVVESSNLNDIAKAIQGTYSSNKTETYNETILKNLCFVYAITDTMVSLHAHDDFVFNDEMVSKNVNKVSLKKGDLLIYFIR